MRKSSWSPPFPESPRPRLRPSSATRSPAIFGRPRGTSPAWSGSSSRSIFRPEARSARAWKASSRRGRRSWRRTAKAEVIDAALISAAQRVEHYEIAAYGCLITYAETLGHDDAAGLLKQTLSEEEAADEKLTQLAEGGINQAAAAVGAGSEEEDE